MTQTGPKISSREILLAVISWREGYSHAGFDICEDVRLDEKSVVGRLGFFSDQKFCTFLLAEFDVIVYFIELDFRDLGSLVGVFVEGIAYFVGLSEFCEFFGEFILDRFMDINSRGRTTDLSLVVEPIVSTKR